MSGTITTDLVQGYLLPYTILTKDDIQDIFNVHQARDLAHCPESIA
jgi:hypothetical protein